VGLSNYEQENGAWSEGGLFSALRSRFLRGRRQRDLRRRLLGGTYCEIKRQQQSLTEAVQCNESYSPEDVITLLPISGKDKGRLNSRISNLKERGLTHSLKKGPGAGKKRKKTDTANGTTPVEATAENGKYPNAVQTSQKTSSAPNGIRNAGTASLTAKVLAEQNDRNKRRKTAENENLKGLFSSSTGETKMQADFMTRGFSIPAGAKR
jgi:hypothetical protein